jgi:pimeloyl-ACP methyl ester carboxylesterase
MKQFVLAVLFFLFVGMWFLCACMQAHADDSSDFAKNTFGDALLPLSMYWGDQAVIDGTTIPLELNEPGVIEWGEGYDLTNKALVAYMNTLENAVFTIQIYEGEVGSSTLMYSSTVPNGNPLSTASFGVRFPAAGHYILAYTATYPNGVFPTSSSTCPADYCTPQNHSLSAFESFMTNGQSEDASAYTDFTPALLGINEFDVVEKGAKASNVLFIPGSMESRLYTRDINGNEKMLWEPTSDSDISLLAMNPDGSSKNFVYTRDIIDYLYSNNPVLESIVQAISKDSSTLYGPFETFMNGLVADGTIRQWQSYPYDWRYDVSDILKNGTLVATPNGIPYSVNLEDVVQELASSSPTGRVTIIAHSNGGLLAKALAVQLQNENKLYLLDRIILVGTPQFGTPSAIGTMLHGDGQTRALGLVTYAGTVRDVALNMPGPYDLLPTPFYFATVAAPVISFGSDVLATYGATYGNAITTYDKFFQFVTNSPALHDAPAENDLATPAVLSPDLLEHAKEMHDAIDSWVAPNSLPIDTIVGTYQLTPQGYVYSSRTLNIVCDAVSLLVPCKNISSLTHAPVYTKFGDGMVVANSAANISQAIYYFASNLYKSDSGINISHQNLLSAAPIQNQIRDFLIGSTSTEQDIYSADSLSPSGNLLSSTIVRSSAPLNIVVTDSQNRESGILPIASLNDMYLATEDIPNSSVENYGNDMSVSFPSSQNTSSVSLQGYSSGNGSIEIGTQDSNGAIQVNQTFPNVPVTASTTGSFTIAGAQVSNLSVDENGDGIISTIPSVPENSAPDDNSSDDLNTSDSSASSTLVSDTTTAATASASGTATAATSTPNSIPNPSHFSGSSNSGFAPAPAATQQEPVSALYLVYLQLEVRLLRLEIELANLLHHRIQLLVL